MEQLVAWIVIFVLAGIPILTAIPLVVIGMRQSNIERHRLRLIHYYFCGHPQVVLPLAGWKLPAAGIRLLAWQRGYVEIRGPDANTLVFRLADSAPAGAPTAPMAPVVPVVAPTGQPTRRQLRRRRQLTKRLTSGDIAWVRPQELGIGMAELENSARAKGFSIARFLGNRADPTVLLSRVPIWRVSDATDPGIGRSLTSLERRIVISAAGGLTAIVGGTSISVLLYRDLPVMLNVGIGTLGVLVLGATVWLSVGVWVRDTTHRMSLMIREFDGRMKLALYGNFYLLDRWVIGDVANELGYAYVGSYHGIYGSSRMNHSRIVYTRTPNYQPRGQR